VSPYPFVAVVCRDLGVIDPRLGRVSESSSALEGLGGRREQRGCIGERIVNRGGEPVCLCRGCLEGSSSTQLDRLVEELDRAVVSWHLTTLPA
jgi:hypothetical protein